MGAQQRSRQQQKAEHCPRCTTEPIERGVDGTWRRNFLQPNARHVLWRGSKPPRARGTNAPSIARLQGDIVDDVYPIAAARMRLQHPSSAVSLHCGFI